MTAAALDQAPTPWAAGRFDGRRRPPTLLFGRTFEDPAIELDLFEPRGRVLAIASAGDTPVALAAAGLSVIAVDINPAQIAETRRRIAGLPPRTGAADRLLAIARIALAPLGWRPDRLAAFSRLDDVDEQQRQWMHLTPPHVRATLRAAMSPRILRVAYGEPFTRMVPRRFADQLLDRMGRRITSAPNRDNPWLSSLMTGTWTGPDAAPIRPQIDLRVGDVARVLHSLPDGSLDGITLSNVIDGPDAVYREMLLAAARRAGRPGAPIVVRSLLPTGDEQAQRRADLDRSLLWGAITVHRATGSTS